MPSIPDEHIERKQNIAQFLVTAETLVPGSIRLYPNPGRTATALSLLAELGYKKPFLTSGAQFAMDCFLTYPNACDRLLTHCLLACSDDEHRQHIWDGYGVFKKCFPGLLPRFEGHEPIIYIINIKPVVEDMSSFLEPSETLKAEADEKALEQVREFFQKNPPKNIGGT